MTRANPGANISGSAGAGKTAWSRFLQEKVRAGAVIVVVDLKQPNLADRTAVRRRPATVTCPAAPTAKCALSRSPRAPLAEMPRWRDRTPPATKPCRPSGWKRREGPGGCRAVS